MLRNLLNFFESTVRHQVPLMTIMVLVLVSVSPLYLPHYDEIAINWSLIGLFYWSVYKPELLHPVSTFLVGLFYDFLAGTPAGMFALIFLLARVLVGIYSRRLRGKTFVSLWVGFSLVVFGTSFVGWLVSSIWYGELLDLVSVLFYSILMVALFPFGAALLIWITRKVYRVG